MTSVWDLVLDFLPVSHPYVYSIVLCKSIVSEGKELILNWPIKNEKPLVSWDLIGQFDINSSFTDNGLANYCIYAGLQLR